MTGADALEVSETVRTIAEYRGAPAQTAPFSTTPSELKLALALSPRLMLRRAALVASLLTHAAIGSGQATESRRCKSDRTFDSSVYKGLWGVPTHYRGVQDAGELFACDKQLIPLSSVDDDYCDCADGSDEPRTGACPDTHFVCTLPRWPQQATVPASRVNDGVCDCCDGSDEWRSAAPCANRCTARGAPGRSTWLSIAAASLFCLLLGGACLCQQPEPTERRLQVVLSKPRPEAALGLTIANAHGREIRRWPVISALEVRSLPTPRQQTSPADEPCRRPCRRALQTSPADEPCRVALQSSPADEPCRVALQSSPAE